MKTIKTLLATIAVLLYSITVRAYDFSTDDNIYYNITSELNHEVECVGIFIPDGPVTIPSQVLYNGVMYRVTSIGREAFSGRPLTSINIPETVTNIGFRAFSHCDELTSINIPSGVTAIEDAVFDYCRSLTSIDIPQNVTTIGVYAFRNCSSLTSITIPKEVTEIGEQAFSNCTNLVSVYVPEGIKTINRETFSYCTSLAFITIPESITNIGEGAFRGCQNINSLTIPKNVTTIGNYSFDGCNIKKIIWKCSVLPEGYDRITGAINYTANSDYAAYSNFKVYPMLGNMFEVDGVTYVPTSMSERTCDVVDYDPNRTASTVNIGPTVVYKDVEFTVNNVNDYTFYGNKYIKEVSLANKGSIGAYALANCSELTSVSLAEGITGIGEYAFNECAKITSIDFPASVNSIGNAVFNKCNELSSITIAESNSKYDARYNCNAVIEKETNKLVAACNHTVIPENVVAIGDYAFSGCEELSTISIHEKVQSIGNYVFSACISLTDVKIEDRSEVLVLGSNGNKALFADCPLNSVYIGGKISYNTGTSSGYSPFSNNASLSVVSITDKEEIIYPYEFYNCSALKDVTIGDALTAIGEYAFSGCTSLESIEYGSSLKTIGIKAFLGCSNLKEVKSGALNPPICGANALDDLDKWNCKLYIPVGYKGAYQTADQWKEFLSVEDNIPIKQYTLTFMVDGDIYHTEQLAYGEKVVLPNTPEKEGYTFKEWEGLPQTMPVTDVVVDALFAINEYTLTYIVDNEEYVKETVAYGASIEVLDAPTKEGHTFNGWSEIPEIMPAGDITITGSFVVNSYKLTYIIDGSIFSSEFVAYGSPINMLEAPYKTGYEFDGWNRELLVMPAEDVEIIGTYTRLPIENYIISDGESSEFSIEEDLECDVITYTRTLSKTNTWNALYVPFEIPMTEEFLEDYDVAYFNDIHSFDNYIGDKENNVLGQDGVIDGMEMEVLKVHEGDVLNANYPYLIRAKNTDALNMNIVVEDATLYQAKKTTISCSSVFMRFDVTGIYTTQTAGELKGEFDVYAMSGGGWKQALNTNQQLKPFRLYLSLSTIDGSPVKVSESAMSRINIRVQGEDTETSILETESGEAKIDIFDLSGRRVQKTQKGLYIVNGKKVIVK